jgi:hypothetical protein
MTQYRVLASEDGGGTPDTQKPFKIYRKKGWVSFYIFKKYSLHLAFLLYM